ncbi:hypothetical protein AQ610_28555 [Burkholderia humptydooensis]|nr:hypothetical protein AQ610_28555 [Burkholderia humptydooensis]
MDSGGRLSAHECSDRAHQGVPDDSGEPPGATRPASGGRTRKTRTTMRAIGRGRCRRSMSSRHRRKPVM